MFNHEEKNIKDLLKQVVGSNKNLEKGIGTVKIEEAWKAEMGEMINSYTEKIYFRQGKMTVYLSSSALRNQLTTSRAKVIDMINKAMGIELVTEINFR